MDQFVVFSVANTLKIFVVDNSVSMYKHAKDVIDLAGCLGYLVKQLDTRGTQVLMTSEIGHKETCTTSTQLKGFVKSGFSQTSLHYCNMEFVLGWL